MTLTRSVAEGHGRKNSIIRKFGTKEKSRDRKDSSVILRDTPCEEKENRDSP